MSLISTILTQGFFCNNIDLKNAVLSKHAEIYSSIDKRMREIHLLNEALSVIESGKNIFEENWQQSFSSPSAEIKRIAQICSRAIVAGATDELYHHLSPRMTQYMPRDVYEVGRKDTLLPLGEFISFEKAEADIKYPNKLYQFVKYSKLGLKITFVFHNQKIDGLWLGYYEI